MACRPRSREGRARNQQTNNLPLLAGQVSLPRSPQRLLGDQERDDDAEHRSPYGRRLGLLERGERVERAPARQPVKDRVAERRLGALGRRDKLGRMLHHPSYASLRSKRRVKLYSVEYKPCSESNHLALFSLFAARFGSVRPAGMHGRTPNCARIFSEFSSLFFVVMSSARLEIALYTETQVHKDEIADEVTSRERTVAPASAARETAASKDDKTLGVRPAPFPPTHAHFCRNEVSLLWCTRRRPA